MHLEEAQGSPGQEAEGHTAACRNQAAVGQNPLDSRGQSPGCQGNHEVHQVPGSGTVAGTAAAAAAGLEGIHREGRVVAVPAGRGTGSAAGWVAQAAAVARQGALTAMYVSEMFIRCPYLQAQHVNGFGWSEETTCHQH